MRLLVIAVAVRIAASGPPTKTAKPSKWASAQPLIDSRGFLRDLLPVLDYAPEAEAEDAASAAQAADGPPSDEGAAAEKRGPAERPAPPRPARARAVTYMKARQVPGDGACLFHALSAGLWRAVNGSHHPMERRVLRTQSLRLRETAIDVLEDARDPRLYMGDSERLRASKLLALAAEQSELSPAAYCAKLREPHAWGGGPEIVALANALRRPIHVYELLWAHADAPCARRTPAPEDGDAPPPPRWCLQCIAEFGSPKFDRRYPPLHILSCDSRFPNLSHEHQLEQGNHFLLLFECEASEARDAALDDGASRRDADALFAKAADRAADRARAVARSDGLDVAPYFAQRRGGPNLPATAPDRVLGLLKRGAAPCALLLCARPFLATRWLRRPDRKRSLGDL